MILLSCFDRLQVNYHLGSESIDRSHPGSHHLTRLLGLGYFKADLTIMSKSVGFLGNRQNVDTHIQAHTQTVMVLQDDR